MDGRGTGWAGGVLRRVLKLGVWTMPLWLEITFEVLKLAASCAIVVSIIIASNNYKVAKNKTALDAYQKYADIMTQVRSLQISNPEIRKIWTGGPESKLSEISPEHFYFAKILFQANELIYLALQDTNSNVSRLPFTLEGWEGNFRTDLESPIFRKIWDDFPHVKKSYSVKFGEKVAEITEKIDLERRKGDSGNEKDAN